MPGEPARGARPGPKWHSQPLCAAPAPLSDSALRSLTPRPWALPLHPRLRRLVSAQRSDPPRAGPPHGAHTRRRRLRRTLARPLAPRSRPGSHRAQTRWSRRDPPRPRAAAGAGYATGLRRGSLGGSRGSITTAKRSFSYRTSERLLDGRHRSCSLFRGALAPSRTSAGFAGNCARTSAHARSYVRASCRSERASCALASRGPRRHVQLPSAVPG